MDVSDMEAGEVLDENHYLSQMDYYIKDSSSDHQIVINKFNGRVIGIIENRGDTLGWVYYNVGRLSSDYKGYDNAEEAIEALMKAREIKSPE